MVHVYHRHDGSVVLGLVDSFVLEIRVSAQGEVSLVRETGTRVVPEVTWDEVTELWCYDNLLTSLPPLPKGLKILSCHTNRLSTLPDLPETLVKLYCARCHLSTLPRLPKGLVVLCCDDNLLETLPTLPDSLVQLDCVNNPFREGVDASLVPEQVRGSVPFEAYARYDVSRSLHRTRLAVVVAELFANPKKSK